MKKTVFILFALLCYNCADPLIEFGEETVFNDVKVIIINHEEENQEEEEEEETINDCLEAVILRSQQEVNEFGARNCEIIGSLWIQDIDGPITSLSALSSITTIEGYLRIRDTSLQILLGLENITTINGSILLEENEKLTLLSGLQNVRYGVTELSIINNSRLTSVFSLRSITTLRNLTLKGNNALTELDGFEKIETIENQLIVQDNITLLNINSLKNVQNATNFSFTGNSYLKNFCGLTTLLQSANFNGSFTTILNGFNPTKEDIISGNCQP